MSIIVVIVDIPLLHNAEKKKKKMHTQNMATEKEEGVSFIFRKILTLTLKSE